MLRITVDEQEDQVRITVEGELSGDLARVLEANWRKAASVGDRVRVVDLCGVTFMDVAGKEVLRHMIRDGAEFIVPGPKTAYIIECLRAENQLVRREQ